MESEETGFYGVTIHISHWVDSLYNNEPAQVPSGLGMNSVMRFTGDRKVGIWGLGLCCLHPAQSLGVPCLLMGSCSGSVERLSPGIRACSALAGKMTYWSGSQVCLFP